MKQKDKEHEHANVWKMKIWRYAKREPDQSSVWQPNG